MTEKTVGIFGTDLTKRVSVLTEEMREGLVKVRGIVNDVQSAGSWSDRFDKVEGLLNCGLITLHYIKEEITKREIQWDDEKFGPSIKFSPRGLGLDDCLGCFICGVGTGLMDNLSAFVSSKEDGEKAVTWFGKGARLDFRPSEPTWIQVKIGTCKDHKNLLEKLSNITSCYSRLRECDIKGLTQ